MLCSSTLKLDYSTTLSESIYPLKVSGASRQKRRDIDVTVDLLLAMFGVLQLYIMNISFLTHILTSQCPSYMYYSNHDYYVLYFVTSQPEVSHRLGED